MLGYSIALAIIAIMISVGGIMLGIGYTLDDRRIKELAKSELYISITNGVILGALIAGFAQNGIITSAINGISSSVTSGYTCPVQMAYNSAICFAYNYVAGTNYINVYNSSYPTILDSTLFILVPLSALYSGLSMLGSIKLNLGIITFGISSALKPLLTPIGYAIDALSLSLISIEIQGALLMFISATALPILLPVGIVLRTLYFTRKLGGAIMAVAIGLFAIFPMTYIFDATLVSSYSSVFSASNVSSYITSAQGVQSGILGKVSNYRNNTGVAVSISNYVSSAIYSLVQSSSTFLQQLDSFLAELIIEVLFLPAFSIIITTISIRELARILGSEMHFGKLYFV